MRTPLETPAQPPRHLIGWDIGGAHLKAAWLQREGSQPQLQLQAVLQRPCPLWQGVARLDEALADILNTWPHARDAHQTQHAVTMTGELVDAFPHREAGVQAIAAALQAALAPGATVSLYAGPAPDGHAARWVGPDEAGAAWASIASANWLATAQAIASALPEALLVDIGSTTTDLVAIRGGQVMSPSRTDLDRLGTGELVYLGMVRTPLCGLGPQVQWQGRAVNVMNEFFATTADVYRLLDELDPAHDQYPPADGADKSPLATRRRLARMIGLDARDAADEDWLALARGWRERQLDLTEANAGRVLAAAGLDAQAPVVLAGAGHALGARLAVRLGRPALRLDALWPSARVGVRPDDLVLAAPCVAVARLLAASSTRAGGAPSR